MSSGFLAVTYDERVNRNDLKLKKKKKSFKVENKLKRCCIMNIQSRDYRPWLKRFILVNLTSAGVGLTRYHTDISLGEDFSLPKTRMLIFFLI